MGGSNTLQEILGGAQVAGGTALTATGSPEVGVPMMVGGIQSAANPQQQQQGQGQGMPQAGNPLAGLNPQMLSQMMGGQQQPKPPMPPTPPMPRPPVSMQNAGQQVATPQPMPSPQVPRAPMGGQQNSAIQKLLQQLLGGSMM